MYSPTFMLATCDAAVLVVLPDEAGVVVVCAVEVSLGGITTRIPSLYFRFTCVLQKMMMKRNNTRNRVKRNSRIQGFRMEEASPFVSFLLGSLCRTRINFWCSANSLRCHCCCTVKTIVVPTSATYKLFFSIIGGVRCPSNIGVYYYRSHSCW